MNPRLLAIVLGTISITCLIYATASGRWLFNHANGVEIGFGLRANDLCLATDRGTPGDLDCRRQTNADYVAGEPGFQVVSAHGAIEDRVSGAFVPMGWATLIECWLAVAGLLVALACAIADKRPDLAVAPTTISLLAGMACLITGCVFVASGPAAANVGVGIGFYAFGAGAVTGIAASLALARVNRPVDRELVPDLSDQADESMNPDHF